MEDLRELAALISHGRRAGRARQNRERGAAPGGRERSARTEMGGGRGRGLREVGITACARGGAIKGTTQQGRREAPGPGLPLLLHENSICATVAAVNALFHTEGGGREERAGYRVRRRERDGCSRRSTCICAFMGRYPARIATLRSVDTCRGASGSAGRPRGAAARQLGHHLENAFRVCGRLRGGVDTDGRSRTQRAVGSQRQEARACALGISTITPTARLDLRGRFLCTVALVR